MNNNLYIDGIAVARILASWLVVITHSMIYALSLPFFESIRLSEFLVTFGAIGVDIFFVISGFIISYSLKGSWLSFLKGRLIRIFPVYIFVFFISLVIFWVKDRSFPDVSELFSYVLLIPSIDSAGHVKNPVGVSWTLSYEVYFYILMASYIGISHGIRLFLVFASFLFFIMASNLYSPNIFLSNPIVFEFIFGMILYFLYMKKSIKFSYIVLFLVLFGPLLLFYTDYLYFDDKLRFDRFIILGSYSFFVVYLMLSIGRFNNLYKYIILSDSSYSLYLTHFVITLPAIGFVSKSIYLEGCSNLFYFFSFVGFLFGASIIFSIFFYKFFEKPMIAFFKKNLI